MLKIAHRGLSHFYPDNSMEAFKQAIDSGFDMIELDIQLCKNNEIIIFHDTYYLSKLIKDYSLEECQRLNMLSLDDFLSKINSKTIKVYFDLKGSMDVCEPLMEKLMQYNVCFENIYISTFNRHHISKLRSYHLPLNIGFTTETGYTRDDLDYLISNIDFFCVHWTALNKELVEYFKNKKILLFTYTAKEYFILSYMKQFDVDGIVSNFDF